MEGFQGEWPRLFRTVNFLLITKFKDPNWAWESDITAHLLHTLALARLSMPKKRMMKRRLTSLQLCAK